MLYPDDLRLQRRTVERIERIESEIGRELDGYIIEAYTTRRLSYKQISEQMKATAKVDISPDALRYTHRRIMKMTARPRSEAMMMFHQHRSTKNS